MYKPIDLSVEGDTIHYVHEGVTYDREWDFWEDACKIYCVPYDKAIDDDLLAVLKGIALKKYNTDIAKELGYPPQYVELLQSILCSADWCDYGTSPRGCWIRHDLDADALIAKLERDIARRWAPD